MARPRKTSNGDTLGFEATLWAAADKLRSNMDASEYKHIVLGLIFRNMAKRPANWPQETREHV